MTFQIGFNHNDKNDTRDFYEFIGATFVNQDEFSYYEIEIKSFEELESLMKKINMKYFNNKFQYSSVVSFDPPTIYLDDNV